MTPDKRNASGVGAERISTSLRRHVEYNDVRAVRTDLRKYIPAPNEPLEVARDFLSRSRQPLKYWRGDHYKYTGTHWERVDSEEIRKSLYLQTGMSFYKDKDGAEKKWAPTQRKIRDLMDALNTALILRSSMQDEDRGTFLLNGQYEGYELREHSEERFNLSCLPFAYDPAAKCPEWEKFLMSSLPDDMAAHAFLQEWFGYVLSGRTDMQTMACLIGVPRAGKGVTARVLEALVGRNNAVGISLTDLTTNFGKGPMVGKLLATISEPKWASREAQAAVEPLLKITGEDSIQIDRKYGQPWEGRLGARLMVLANEAPRLTNSSGALAARMVNVRFTESFEGREDRDLEGRILRELPGIFNWAMDGLERLEAPGSRFTVPDSHKEIEETVREYGDQDGVFIEECCDVGAGLEVSEGDLFQAYRAWCLQSGRTRDSTNAMTLRHRMKERPGLSAARRGQRKVQTIVGLKPTVEAMRAAERLADRVDPPFE